MELLNLNNTTLINFPPTVRICVGSLVKGSMLFAIQPQNDLFGNSVYSLDWSHILVLTYETVDLVAANLGWANWLQILACKIGIMVAILGLNSFAHAKDEKDGPLYCMDPGIGCISPTPPPSLNRSLTPAYNCLMKCIMKLFELVIVVNVGFAFFRGEILMPSIVSIFYIALLVNRNTDLVPKKAFDICYTCCANDIVFAITRVVKLTGSRQKSWMSYCIYAILLKLYNLCKQPIYLM